MLYISILIIYIINTYIITFIISAFTNLYSIISVINLRVLNACSKLALLIVSSDNLLINSASRILAAICYNKLLDIGIISLLTTAVLAVTCLQPISILNRRLKTLKNCAFNKRY
jgi:hypothetical protein